MNDLDLCLEVVSRSCRPLRHIGHWISRKLLEIDSVPWTSNGKWPMGNPMITWPMTSREPEGHTHDHNTLRAQYLENIWLCYLATIAN